MPRSHTRRRVLQWVGGGIVGLAGCIQAGGPESDTTVNPDPGPDSGATGADGNTQTTAGRTRTYAIEVRNELTAENFEASDQLSEPTPAVVTVRIDDLDPDEEPAYFEETVELGIGEAQTVPEAFTVSGTRTIYEITATLEPFVDGGISTENRRRETFIFTAWGDKMPDKDPIAVIVANGNSDGEALSPYIGLDPLQGDACDRRDFC